jgi:multiple sugar transport system ATP-binding protein
MLPTENTMGVRFEGVSKQFGAVDALIDFSLDVDDGEFMVLLGPSGCGKTTALRILAGLEEPSAGEVMIDGRVVTDLAAHDRDIAMVFQNYALYPHMSVYDNIAFGLRTRHIPRHEIDRLVRGAADLLGIPELLKRKPGQLSGGQRQRVALGRAIVRRPKAFLMDEPLSNLDAKLRAQTRLELIHLHRELKTTVVYVTHDQVEAMTMGRRIAVLDRGRLQQVGSPKEIYERPANRFVAEFIGSPSMSFFSGPVGAGDAGALTLAAPGVTFTIPAGRAAALRAAALSDAVLGVRPEHIELVETLGGRAAAGTFDAVVDVVESLGNELHVTLLLGDRSIIARLPADAAIEAGQTRRFAVAPEHILLFDPAGERRFD